MKKFPSQFTILSIIVQSGSTNLYNNKKLLMNLLSKDDCDSARHYFLDESVLTK